jgi:hypothetical protein
MPAVNPSGWQDKASDRQTEKHGEEEVSSRPLAPTASGKISLVKADVTRRAPLRVALPCPMFVGEPASDNRLAFRSYVLHCCGP